jgi:hypothetical protein
MQLVYRFIILRTLRDFLYFEGHFHEWKISLKNDNWTVFLSKKCTLFSFTYIALSSNNVMKDKTLLALTALRIYVTTWELSFCFPRIRKVFVSYGVIRIFCARPVSAAASF